MSYTVIHEDDRLVVVDKPTGLLSVPGIGPEKADCLVARMQDEFPGARIVHRLDRDTSGVIVLARDAEAHRKLSMQFQDRKVSKTYTAIVHGRVDGDAGQIDLPLAKDMDNPPRQRVDHEHGRWALTDWFVTERLDDRTRLTLKPTTGRSHQLRVHLLEMGHPILGDDLYAPPEALAMADRLCLHAQELIFFHPDGGAREAYTANCPF